MKSWKTTINVSLSRSQFNSSSSQTSVCLFVRRQHVILRIFAVNQNASINKNSKNSNSRSLRQHTFAKSISLCCFCFCFAREIDRFFILICRYLSHQFDKIFDKILNKILNKIFIFDIYVFSLFSHIFCFFIYFFMFIVIALKLSASTMICHAIYVAVNEFLRNIDRLKEWNSRFETKLEKNEKIMLRTCLEKSFDWILFYQRKFIWELM